MTIYICTNEELLLRRTDEEQCEALRHERIEVALQEAYTTINQAWSCETIEQEVEESSSFSDWSDWGYGCLAPGHHQTTGGLIVYTKANERGVAVRAARTIMKVLKEVHDG